MTEEELGGSVLGQFSVTSLMNAPFFPCVKGFLSVKKPLLMDYQNVNIMNLIWSFRCNKVLSGVVGHRSIVDKSSAYRAKGPGFNSRWRQEFICINCIACSVHLRK